VNARRNIMRKILFACLFICAATVWGQGYEGLKWGASIAEVKKAYPGLVETTDPARDMGRIFSQKPQDGSHIASRTFSFQHDKFTAVTEVYTNSNSVTMFFKLADICMRTALTRLAKDTIELKPLNTVIEDTREFHGYNGSVESEEKNTAVFVILRASYATDKTALAKESFKGVVAADYRELNPYNR
jgi:hypothetical protein